MLEVLFFLLPKNEWRTNNYQSYSSAIVSIKISTSINNNRRNVSKFLRPLVPLRRVPESTYLRRQTNFHRMTEEKTAHELRCGLKKFEITSLETTSTFRSISSVPCKDRALLSHHDIGQSILTTSLYYTSELIQIFSFCLKQHWETSRQRKLKMAPQHESLPLVTDYGAANVKGSGANGMKMRRVSSIQKELGPSAQKGTASVFNVGINLAKTAGMNHL